MVNIENTYRVDAVLPFLGPQNLGAQEVPIFSIFQPSIILYSPPAIQNLYFKH